MNTCTKLKFDSWIDGKCHVLKESPVKDFIRSKSSKTSPDPLLLNIYSLAPKPFFNSHTNFDKI